MAISRMQENFCFFCILRIEPRALYIWGKHSATELFPIDLNILEEKNGSSELDSKFEVNIAFYFYLFIF